MQPRLQNLHQKKLVGIHRKMSLIHNKTHELWQSFMTTRKVIQNQIGTHHISMQIYDKNYFEDFNPASLFEKWAAAEVIHFDHVPDEMETFLLAGGLYAIFIHKGSSTDTQTHEYIFRTWLPSSNYVLDNRPHFEILGEKYKNNDPNSEEEIWIPIKMKH